MKAKLLIVLAFAVIAASAASADGRANADCFFETLRAYCGEAYAGRVVVNKPVTGVDPFANRFLVMYASDCAPDEIRLNFFVSDEGEREWILKRTATGLQLRHTHRAEGGIPAALSNYGGETVGPGTPNRQEFPADQATIALFNRENLDIGRTNVWALEFNPDDRFVYELARDDGRLLQIEFDLSRPVEAPETDLTLAARRSAEDWEN